MRVLLLNVNAFVQVSLGIECAPPAHPATQGQRAETLPSFRVLQAVILTRPTRRWGCAQIPSRVPHIASIGRGASVLHKIDLAVSNRNPMA